MDILVSLVQLGGVGASLAFLILGYNLLKKEMDIPEPRPIIIQSVKFFIAVALVFFVFGVVAEVVLTNAGRVIVAYIGSVFRNDLLGIRITDTEYSPDQKSIGFRLNQSAFDDTSTILPAERPDYSVVVGVRKKSGEPITAGSYPYVFGPYPFGETTPQTIQLEAADIAALDGCIEMAAFAVKNSESKSVAKPPLNPEDHVGTIKYMSERYMCKLEQ